MKTYAVFFALIASFLFLFGCTGPQLDDDGNEVISIRGKSERKTIETDNPVKLIIVGEEHDINVADGVKVVSITITGGNNVVSIDSSMGRPLVKDNGAANSIIYR
jgi:hypothetical protein